MALVQTNKQSGELEEEETAEEMPVYIQMGGFWLNMNHYHVMLTQCGSFQSYMLLKIMYDTKFHDWKNCRRTKKICGICLQCCAQPYERMCPFQKAAMEVEQMHPKACLHYKILSLRALLRKDFPIYGCFFRCPLETLNYDTCIGNLNCEAMKTHILNVHRELVTTLSEFVCPILDNRLLIIYHMQEIFVYEKKFDENGLIVTVHRMGFTSDVFQCTIGISKTNDEGQKLHEQEIIFDIGYVRECRTSLTNSSYRCLYLSQSSVGYFLNKHCELDMEVKLKKVFPRNVTEEITLSRKQVPMYLFYDKEYYWVNTRCAFGPHYVAVKTAFEDIPHDWMNCSSTPVICGICLGCYWSPVKCTFQRTADKIEERYSKACLHYKVTLHRMMINNQKLKWENCIDQFHNVIKCDLNASRISEEFASSQYFQRFDASNVIYGNSFICQNTQDHSKMIRYMNEIFIYDKRLSKTDVFVSMHRFGLTNDLFNCTFKVPVRTMSEEYGDRLKMEKITFDIGQAYECKNSLIHNKSYISCGFHDGVCWNHIIVKIELNMTGIYERNKTIVPGMGNFAHFWKHNEEENVAVKCDMCGFSTNNILTLS